GQQHGRGLAGVAAEGCGLLPDGQGVEVGHHIQAVELILQLGPVADRPNVVAQSKGAGGLDAGQNDALALALLTHKNASLCIDADRISRQEAGGPNRPAAEKKPRTKPDLPVLSRTNNANYPRCHLALRPSGGRTL